MSCVRIDCLHDSRMPEHQRRYGPLSESLADGALHGALGQLSPGMGESLGICFAVSPDEKAPQDSLKIYVSLPAGEGSAPPLKGTHLLGQFYRLTPADAGDARRGLEGHAGTIYSLTKMEELYLEKDCLYYAPVPFPPVGAGAFRGVVLDDIFCPLKAPCVVSIRLAAASLTSEQRNALVREIEELDRLASGRDPERREGGVIDELIRGRSPLASRIRDSWMAYLKEMFQGRVYRFDVDVVSRDDREAEGVARAIGLELVPEGKFEIEAVRPGSDHYAGLRESIETLRPHEGVFHAFDGSACFSARLAGCAERTARNLGRSFGRAVTLSFLSRLATWDMARRMCSLPTSSGAYYRTIRIESEPCEPGSPGDETRAIEIGAAMDRPGTVRVGLDLWAKHGLICGVTGSGKTVTAQGILTALWEECGIPFTLFVPVADPYRVLFRSGGALAEDLQIVSPGNDRLSPFAFNLLEVPEGVPIETHIADLGTVFNGAFESEGPLRPLLSESVEHCYRAAGFRPSDRGRADAPYPTTRELCRSAWDLIGHWGYSGEVRANLQAAVKSRLVPLTKGNVGRVFSAKRSKPTLEDILRRPTIVETDHLNLGEQNLLQLGVTVQSRRRFDRMGHSRTLRHLIVIEEAHCLVGTESRAAVIDESHADPRVHAARFLVKCITEGRDLGLGFLIIDQSAQSIWPEILRNTGVKIVHRTTEAKDREIMASSMLMDPVAQEELARFQPGECYIYHEHLYSPIRVKSRNRFAGMERPTEEEVYGLIRDRSWFREARDARLAMKRERLDGLLRELKNTLAALVRLRRRGENGSAFLRSQTLALRAVREAVRKMEDLLGEAALDRALSEVWGDLSAHYRKRLKSLLGEAGRIMH